VGPPLSHQDSTKIPVARLNAAQISAVPVAAQQPNPHPTAMQAVKCEITSLFAAGLSDFRAIHTSQPQFANLPFAVCRHEGIAVDDGLDDHFAGAAQPNPK